MAIQITIDSDHTETKVRTNHGDCIIFAVEDHDYDYVTLTLRESTGKAVTARMTRREYGELAIAYNNVMERPSPRRMA